MDKLRRMLALETAASDWWDKLTPAEKKGYVNAHPGTHMVNGKPAMRDLHTVTILSPHDGSREDHYSSEDLDKVQAEHRRLGITGLKPKIRTTPGSKRDASGLHANYALRHLLPADKRY